jgi:hypothetical protein
MRRIFGRLIPTDGSCLGHPIVGQNHAPPLVQPGGIQTALRGSARLCQEAWAQSLQMECRKVYEFILFMANTGLRPDEAFNLQHRDVTIATDDGTKSENSISVC